MTKEIPAEMLDATTAAIFNRALELDIQADGEDLRELATAALEAAGVVRLIERIAELEAPETETRILPSGRTFVRNRCLMCHAYWDTAHPLRANEPERHNINCRIKKAREARANDRQ